MGNRKHSQVATTMLLLLLLAAASISLGALLAPTALPLPLHRLTPCVRMDLAAGDGDTEPNRLEQRSMRKDPLERLSTPQAVNERITSDQPSVLFFGARWCASCRALQNRMRRLAGSTANVFFVDHGESKEAFEEHEISAVPTFAFFERGALTERWSRVTHREWRALEEAILLRAAPRAGIHVNRAQGCSLQNPCITCPMSHVRGTPATQAPLRRATASPYPPPCIMFTIAGSDTQTHRPHTGNIWN